jgi:hypothetical protein
MYLDLTYLHTSAIAQIFLSDNLLTPRETFIETFQEKTTFFLHIGTTIGIDHCEKYTSRPRTPKVPATYGKNQNDCPF